MTDWRLVFVRLAAGAVAVVVVMSVLVSALGTIAVVATQIAWGLAQAICSLLPLLAVTEVLLLGAPAVGPLARIGWGMATGNPFLAISGLSSLFTPVIGMGEDCPCP